MNTNNFGPDFILQAFITLFVGLIVTAVIVGVLGLGSYLVYLWYKYRHREEVSIDSTLLQIALPRDNEIKIDAAEQLFSSLSSIAHHSRFSFLHMEPSLSFEIVGLPGDIRFYVHTPNNLRDLVEKQINGAYPDAEITEIQNKDGKNPPAGGGKIIGGEYNIFSETGSVSFAALKLTGANYTPIKVYKDLPVDPLSSITSVLTKMTDGEGAAIQILIWPASHKWQSKGRHHIAKTKKSESNPETAHYATDAKELEGIENKASKPQFHATIRIVVSSTSQEIAKSHLSNIISAFQQFGGTNGFKKIKRVWFKNAFMTDFIYRYQSMRGYSSILTSEELATIFHLPNKSITTPNIYYVTSKRAPASSRVPQTGDLILGQSTFRGFSRPVSMQLDDRRRHMYIIGRTGTGKTEMLKDMILQDIRAGKGMCVIDPHGDLVEDVLQMMPPERAEDVILFDPANTSRPMAINIMEAYSEEQRHYIVSSIIGLFYKLYDPHKTGIVGPRLEHSIRNAMLTVMYEPGATFIEVQRALTDTAYVQEILPKVTDPIIRRYWTDQIAQTSDFHKSEVLDYIVSKFSRFTTNKLMRNIIGQSKSSFNFREIMDEGKIMLISLSKGIIGEENSSFLGLILVPQILSAAMSRQNIPMEKRRDFFLYVDEFQNFATPDFAAILSEARKYRLNLVVANQFIGQMEEEVKNAIFGNVGTLVSFRVGVTDANYLQHEFSPVFNETDLINVDKYNAYMRTMVEGEPVPPFSLNLQKDMTKEKALMNPRVAELVKELSSLKYAKDAKLVEAEISQRARL